MTEDEIYQLVNRYQEANKRQDHDALMSLVDSESPMYTLISKSFQIRQAAQVTRIITTALSVRMVTDRAMVSLQERYEFASYQPMKFFTELDIRQHRDTPRIWSQITLPQGIGIGDDGPELNVKEPVRPSCLIEYIQQIPVLLQLAMTEYEVSPQEAFKATVKWYRYLQLDPGLDSSISASFLCSVRTWEFVRKIRELVSAGYPQPHALAAVVATNVRHIRRYYPDPIDPWGAVHGKPVAPSIGIDEMAGFSGSLNYYSGSCGSLQHLNTALWRLTSIEPKKVVQLRLLGSFGMHELTCSEVNNDLYTGSSEYILSGERLFLPFVEPSAISLYAMYNDTGYWDLRNNTASVCSSTTTSWRSLIKRMAPCIPIAETQSPDIFPGQQPNIVSGTSCCGHSPESTRLNLYRHGHKFKYLALARYSMQSLFVHKPEAYILAGERGPVVARLAETIHDLRGLVGYVRRHIRMPSIFAEPDRLMYPDQCIVFGAGNSYDIGLLCWSIMRSKGVSCSLILCADTHKDEAYLKCPDTGSSFLRMSDFELVTDITGNKVIEFAPDTVRQWWRQWG